MTFRQLEYILEVAEQGSISVAARKLMISQPSLSQTIKSIENEYNISLFDRSAVPLVPTKAGSVFLNKAQLILATLDDLKTELSQADAETNELRIGISDSAALINKHIFKEFQKYYSNLKLILVERDQFLLERMLQAGKLDMIFTMIPYERSNLEVIPLVEDELLIALPIEHPASLSALKTYPELRKKHSFPVIDLLECKDVNFVLSGRDRLKYTQLSALRNVFDPEIGFETDSLASAVSIASYMPHGTVVPKLFSTLYDGPDKPMFFRCKEKLPQWSFALSLPKNVAVSEAGCKYIELFVNYINGLGLLNDGLNCEGIIKQIKSIKGKKSID